MNSQYMQHQHPHYGSPSPHPPYGELNANLPPKGSQDLSTIPPQKPPLGPPPTSNVSPNARSPYYVNDIQGQASNIRHGPPLPSNQNNLVDQMSGMALSSSQRPPSSQGLSSQSEKDVPPVFPSTVNGISNKNHYPVSGELGTNNLMMEKSGQAHVKSLPHQKPGLPTLQAPNLSSPYGSAGGSQFLGQQPPTRTPPPLGSVPGSSALRSTPQPSPTNRMQSQNKYNTQPTNQTDLAGPPSNANTQPSFSAPPLTNHPTSSNSHPPLGPPPLNTQQNMSGPPLPGQFPSAPPVTNRQNLSSPPLSGPGMQGPPSMGQQSLSRPPLPGQPSNLSGPPAQPPVAGQQNLPSPYQQNTPNTLPLQAQQSFQSQYGYNNQPPEQRRYASNPSVPGHQTTTNYGQVNHQHSETGYHQGYQQQQNYGQTGQTASPYQTGMASPTGGFQPAQPQQNRRLDPEQMPSPIQVMQDDEKTKGGVFITNQKGLVPPLVTTKFTVEDQGNASPRFIRSSIYTVPTTADIVKQTQIPFALILNPLAEVEEGEYEPFIVDMGEHGPVRCNRCKAYMSPFMQFIDAGRRFQCILCKSTTEVPTEYFQHLDHTGQRMDRFERPELMLGTYEFLATKEYCQNETFPKPPAIIFAIDVSYNNIKSGLVNLICCQMKNIIRNLPIDVGQTKSNMKVGFITYSNTVQFYNIKASLAQPQMMIVGDVQDVFMPLLDGFLCDPEESEALIDSLMSQIPTMFGDTRETETILIPAIQAGLEALKASNCAGKVLVFHSSLPTAEAPGKLKNRDDRKLLGTDKEKSILTPQTNLYNNLGQDCVGAGCSVDLFIFNNSYVDIATIGQVARLTGGEVYKYTYFQADIDGERLITDVINNISRPVAFDAVMRVRTSTGVRPTDFYGHFYMSNTTDIELASIDCEKAVAVEIKHDDKLSEDDGVYIQAALVYTSCGGVRRLRIMNLSLKTSSQMAELYRSCDVDAIINFLSKQSVFKLVDASPKAVKDNLIARCAAILASYRKHCALPSSAGQLVLPECMKLLPLYINGLLKSDAISGGNGITVDQKSYVMMAVATMPISESVVHVYPRLFPLHNVDSQDTDLPPMLRCSLDKFSDDGAYLLENGIHMFLWLGSNLSPQWVQSVFGVASVVQVDTDKTAIPALDNPLNKRIKGIISHIQSERRYCMRLTLIRQREKMEIVLRQFLVEDRGADGSSSYVDFLCYMHREIRTLLS